MNKKEMDELELKFQIARADFRSEWLQFRRIIASLKARFRNWNAIRKAKREESETAFDWE